MAEEKKQEFWRWTESNWKNPNIEWKDAKFITVGIDVGGQDIRDGSGGIASSTTGKEVIAATEEHQLLCHINTTPARCRALRMPVDQGRSIVGEVIRTRFFWGQNRGRGLVGQEKSNRKMWWL
jgi:hypothetical protein